MAARLARRSGSYRDHGVVTRADRKIDEHGRPLAGRANQHHGATQGLDLISHTHQPGTPCRVGPSNALVSDAGTNITQRLILRTRSLDRCPGQLAQVIEQASAHFQGPPAWQCPQASYTAFVQLPFPAEAFCRHLALERRILLLPGSVFGPAYENFIRVGLGGDTQQFQEGMSIMLDELLRWRERSHMRG